MVVLLLGDFKDLYKSLIQLGYRATVDPTVEHDAILTTASLYLVIPEDNRTPVIIRLFRKLTDMKVKRNCPGAMFAYSNEEIMRHLEAISMGKQ